MIEVFCFYIIASFSEEYFFLLETNQLGKTLWFFSSAFHETRSGKERQTIKGRKEFVSFEKIRQF